MRKNKIAKWFENNIVFLLLLITIAIILSMICREKIFFIYEFFNNQTIAILIGTVTITIGFQAWKNQHKIELRDKYLESIIESFHAEMDLNKRITRVVPFMGGPDLRDLKDRNAHFEKQMAYLSLLEVNHFFELSEKLRMFLTKLHDEITNDITAEEFYMRDRDYYEEYLLKSESSFRKALLILTAETK